jgi:hypothetical protein
MRNPLQVPFETEFTPLQDWLCFLGAVFLLLFPLTLAVLIGALVLSLY